MGKPIFLFEKKLNLPKGTATDESNAHPLSANESYEKILPILKEIGVTRIVEITSMDKIGVPVFNCIKPDLNYYSVAHGKGITRSGSRISACMECLERYFGVNGKVELIKGSYNEFIGKFPMVNFDDIHLAKHSIFTPDSIIEWAKGWDIMNNTTYYYPKGLVNLKLGDTPLEDDFLLFQNSSNGLSGGMFILEAILQGLYEVIERDAITISILSKQSQIEALYPQAIDPKSIFSDRVEPLLAKIEKAGLKVNIYDNTTDTKVPTFTCNVIDNENFSTTGWGSSLDWEVALSRAVTEAIQARAIFQASVRDVYYNDDFQAGMLISSKIESDFKPLRKYPKIQFENFESELHYILDNLKKIGIDKVLVFPLTENDLQVQVVKVVIPSLENIWEFLHFESRDRWMNLKNKNK